MPAILIKLLISLLTSPGILGDVETIIAEITSHDPQSEKVTNILNNVAALSTAVNTVRNGANG